jgi:hypothetical protein
MSSQEVEYIKQKANEENIKYEDYLHLFSKNFNINKLSNIEKVYIVVNKGDQFIEVDELLAPLLEIINKDDLLSISSSQYNNFGYSTIVFSFEGYRKFYDNLVKKAKELFDIQYHMLNVIKRFHISSSTHINNFMKRINNELINEIVLANKFSRQKNQSDLIVNWHFLQEDIPEITSELKSILG